MTPQQLRLVKNFWAKAETQLDSAIPQMYEKFFVMVPEARALFKGPLHTQQIQFAEMLGGIVRLTRSSHLWPVSAFTGQAVIPGLDHLRCQHARAGVRSEYFHKMKLALVGSFSESFPADFTPEVREAFGTIFDVLTRSLTETPQRHDERDTEQARFLNRQPAQNGGSFAEYMNPSAVNPFAVM